MLHRPLGQTNPTSHIVKVYSSSLVGLWLALQRFEPGSYQRLSNLKDRSSCPLSIRPTLPEGWPLQVTGIFGIRQRASVTVQNIGSVDGADVLQLYIEYPKSTKQPVRQLSRFENVDIKAGHSMHLNFELRCRDISYWDANAQKWATATGMCVVCWCY
jgi:hypothetical protein